MGLFDRKVSKAAISPAPAKAAAAGSNSYANPNSTVNVFNQYYSWREGEARNQLMTIPAVSRCRDLLASVIACMPLRAYNMSWDGERMVKNYIAPRSWMRQPDPQNTYAHFFSWVFDDLYMFGRSVIHITSRTSDGFPASFQRLPVGSITTTDQTGPVWFAPSNQVYFNGVELDTRDLLQILSPTTGLVYTSVSAVETALKVEAARNRNASSSIPAGILKQTGGEPLSAQELADLAAAFNAARATNQTAALNEFLSYEATTMSPDKMLLIESANYSALEMARLGNVPPYLVGVSTGSYSYQSSQQARADLYIFGVKLYAEAIAEAFSMNSILPIGTYVEFDAENYLAENYLADQAEEPQENTQEELANR